jgi:hypothetical protein
VTYPIVIKSLGTELIRSELTTPRGTSVRIVNRGSGAVLRNGQIVLRLADKNTVDERVDHIPALSVLAECGDSGAKPRHMGVERSGPQPADIVSVESGHARPKDAPKPHVFHIDQASGTVSKLEYSNYAENRTDSEQKVEIVYSDYRRVHGVLVPFRQQMYGDGKLLAEMTLTEAEFNVGLQEAEFAIPAPGRAQ